jgi:diguanylate cyclase (GGDEF)-like protein/PAS domain S-box-containing protein
MDPSRLRNQPEAVYQLVEKGPGMVVITDYEGNIIAINPRCVSETGYTAEEVLGENPRLWNSGRQPEHFYENLWETIKSGEIWRGAFCNRKKNGDLFWTRAIIVPVSDDSGEITKFASVHEIVTEEHRLRERLKATVETAKNAIVTMDEEGKIEDINPAALEMFSCEKKDFRGEKADVILPDTFEILEEYKKNGDDSLIEGRREEIAVRCADEQFPVDVGISEFETDTGLKFVAIITDRTEEVQYRAKIENLNEELEEKNQYLGNLAVVDSLTDLPNRRRFEEKLKDEWEHCLRDKKEISIIMMDLDNFKNYNDFYGHPAGDTCLKKVASVMDDVIKRSIDTVARYGGEEFAAILPETSLKGAEKLGEEIRRRIEEKGVEHQKSEVSDVVTISVGAAFMVPRPEMGAWLLVEKADQALCRAKENGRNRVETIAVR